MALPHSRDRSDDTTYCIRYTHAACNKRVLSSADSLLTAVCGVVAPAGGGRVTWLRLWLLQVPTEGAL
jgi:hypothetical protein